MRSKVIVCLLLTRSDLKRIKTEKNGENFDQKLAVIGGMLPWSVGQAARVVSRQPSLTHTRSAPPLHRTVNIRLQIIQYILLTQHSNFLYGCVFLILFPQHSNAVPAAQQNVLQHSNDGS
jgi:hypothetical protein